MVVVDDTRPTRAVPQEDLAARPERTLATTVWLPADPSPAPLVVFSHGLMGHPRKFDGILRRWAEAGIVVAAPAFPLTNDRDTKGVYGADGANQPADVRAVLDEVLRLAGEEGSPLAGRIDPARIGVGGLSLGGVTTYAVAFGTCCRDDRIDAVMVMASTPLAPSGELELDAGLPLMVLHGDKDPIFPIAAAGAVFDLAEAPKYFVTVAGAGHAEAFEDAPDGGQQPGVDAITTAFWQRHLLGDEKAAAGIVTIADDDPHLDLRVDAP